jgi:hypothetical protein
MINVNEKNKAIKALKDKEIRKLLTNGVCRFGGITELIYSGITVRGHNGITARRYEGMIV